MDTVLTQMLTVLGVRIENTGSTLQSDTPLCDEHLTELQRTLSDYSRTVQQIRYLHSDSN